MKKILICLLVSLTISSLLLSCGYRKEVTPDTSYILEPPAEPKYSFSRAGTSSVRNNSCEFLDEPINYISRKIQHTTFDSHAYGQTREYFEFGKFGIAPLDNICSSSHHVTNKDRVTQDLENWYHLAISLQGYDKVKKETVSRKNIKAAKEGVGGLVARDIRDENAFFVDAQGLAVSYVWEVAIHGAIYLDKILNLHLSPAVVSSTDLRDRHERLELVTGGNYTALEHHWDMAYGYFKLLQRYKYTTLTAIPELSDINRDIFLAFVEGRRAILLMDYERMEEQAQIIRKDLSLIFAVQAISQLSGRNVQANMREDIRYALKFLSLGYGTIYALQFTTNGDGTPLMSNEQVEKILQNLMGERGLWDKEHLLADAKTSGSIAQISQELRRVFDIPDSLSIK